MTCIDDSNNDSESAAKMQTALTLSTAITMIDGNTVLSGSNQSRFDSVGEIDA